MAYIPAYMGNCIKSATRQDVEEIKDCPDSNFDQHDPLQTQEKFESELHISQVEEMPLKTRASGLWDFQVRI